MLASRYEVARTFIEWLRDNTTIGNGVGDGVPPSGAEPPYVIVYDSDGASYGTDPDIDTPFMPYTEGMLDVPFQLSLVTVRPDQMRLMADRVRDLMLRIDPATGRPPIPAPTGYVVAAVEPDGSGAPIIEGETPHRRYTLPERYVLRVVPA